MQRILVTGNAGSGKSTLAALVAMRMEVPLTSLDSVVWQRGWAKTPRTERTEMETAIANRDSWVVDGVSDIVLSAADTVIFLDLSLPQCYWRTFKRNLPYLFRSRPGLPENCPEIRIIPTLTRLIWRFPNYVRPRILEACMNGKKRFVHIRNTRDLDQFTHAALSELKGGVDHGLWQL